MRGVGARGIDCGLSPHFPCPRRRPGPMRGKGWSGSMGPGLRREAGAFSPLRSEASGGDERRRDLSRRMRSPEAIAAKNASRSQVGGAGARRGHVPSSVRVPCSFKRRGTRTEVHVPGARRTAPPLPSGRAQPFDLMQASVPDEPGWSRTGLRPAAARPRESAVLEQPGSPGDRLGKR